jgi:hypothetical protein
MRDVRLSVNAILAKAVKCNQRFKFRLVASKRPGILSRAFRTHVA